MKTGKDCNFSSAEFLRTEGPGRRLVHLKPAGVFFSQGTESNFVVHLLAGRAKLTVVSQRGKEATITLLTAGDFIGEEAVANEAGLRTATASAITACTAMKISRDEMIRVLHDEVTFSVLFVRYLLARGVRTQADLVDQLFNSSEKRLARTLLLMASFGKPGEPVTLIPPITQEALADMIGTTRSRISFFMNRFRRLGYIKYNGRILPSKEPIELSAIIAKVSGVVDSANTTIGDVRVRVDGVLDDFKTTVNNTNGLVTDARFGKGAVATLLNDPTTAAHVKETAANAEQASAKLVQASQQAQQVVADFQSRNLPAKVDESVTNVRQASEQIDQASQRVNSTLAQALGPDRTGVSAAQNLSETLYNAKVATGNLAEDTEAIKHEFFFRGFFKKRGYYSLSDLTPDEYRNNRLFNDQRDKRFWLGADSFTQDANGTEILSVQGQIQVDQIVGTEGDAIMEVPIMIEGYSTELVPYQRVLLSSARSAAVAHYLEKRFKLQSSNLGTISLDAKPPKASGKDLWNGACIVFLSNHK
jgi:CRP-like cAMP-binding protein